MLYITKPGGLGTLVYIDGWHWTLFVNVLNNAVVRFFRRDVFDCYKCAGLVLYRIWLVFRT
jgi:hypothetical protein